ncbi:YopX family protein [Capnocytophaga gingivalis]|jgi:phage protein|nr:MAG TPA: YopX protein [Caudoviricetes sp.]
MKTIKFRAKTKNEEWIYNLAPLVPFSVFDLTEIDRDTLTQFTGLHDCHGAEIYEGDFLKINLSEGYKIRLVCYNEDVMGFCLAHLEYWNNPFLYNLYQFSFSWWERFKNDIKVIGNRYDNPEIFNQYAK